MKRFITLLVALLIALSFVGCDSANIEVGSKDGVAYFHHSPNAPEIILMEESETKIEDTAFFGKLIAAIDGKPAANDFCNCEAIYNVKIDKYTFALHTHGITISSPMGHNLRGINIFTVECTEEEMNELFAIVESAS